MLQAATGQAKIRSAATVTPETQQAAAAAEKAPDLQQEAAAAAAETPETQQAATVVKPAVAKAQQAAPTAVRQVLVRYTAA